MGLLQTGRRALGRSSVRGYIREPRPAERITGCKSSIMHAVNSSVAH